MSFGLSRKTDYALVALAALAEPGDGEPAPLSARQIAERYDLPQALLMNVLKDLHRAGLVVSRRGAGGGYMLADTPERVSILDVIEATDGRVRVALCCEEEEEHDEPCVACRIQEHCPIVSPMQRFNELTLQFLAGVSLAQLVTPDRAGQPSDPSSKIGAR